LASLRSAHGPDLPAVSSAAEELIAAIGLETRHAQARSLLEPRQDFARTRIDAGQIALVAFPGAVPELAVDPADPGDKALGLDGTKDRPGLRIDLMNLAVAILRHPE